MSNSPPPNLTNLNSRSILGDLLKDIGILLVILGHNISFSPGAEIFNIGAYVNDRLYLLIYSFHMPLFALISGYFFFSSVSKTNPKTLIQQRFKQYLIPFFFWGLFIYTLTLARGATFSLDKMCAFILKSYWFIPATLYSWLIASVIHHRYQDRWYIHLLAALLLCLLPRKIGWFHFWGISYLYPFFVMGYFYRKYQDIVLHSVQRVRWIILLFMTIFFALSVQRYSYEHLAYGNGFCLWDIPYDLMKRIRINGLRIIVGVSGSLALIYTFFLSYKYLPKWGQETLAYLGRNSLAIYLLQEVLIIYIIKPMNLQGYTVSHPYLSAVALTVVVAALSALFIMGIQRLAPSLSLYLLG